MLDLYHATREELIATLRGQRDLLAEQERRLAAQAQEIAGLQSLVAELTAQLGASTSGEPADDPSGRGTPKGVPGLKPTDPVVQEPRSPKRRATGFGRSRMVATASQIHALGACPDCGAPLAGGTRKRSREVIELCPPTIVVTEHVYLERRCPDCGRRCVPPPSLAGVVLGQSRLGHRLVSLITVLREEGRLPFATIRQLLTILTGLQLSEGALVAAVQRVGAQAEPVMAGIQATIRASPVVHADETGWREAGHNGYVWTFSTPQQRLFLRGSRAKAMVSETLGDAFEGVLVSDFYAAYTSYEGVHQYCWAHLLRDIAELVEQHPTDDAVQGWAVAVGAIFGQAQAAATGLPAARWRARTQAETDLRRLCEPWQAPRKPQTALCQRILRRLESLFVFVTEPGVPATNNPAERSLRHLVVSRKISGGTRSPRGTATKMTLASLFGTWRAQGINPYTACCDLLASPQV